MIKMQVVTEMQFKDEFHLNQYLNSAYMSRITGFRDEIKTAWITKKPLEVKTHRPEHGVVTISEIRCFEDGAEEK